MFRKKCPRARLGCGIFPSREFAAPVFMRERATILPGRPLCSPVSMSWSGGAWRRMRVSLFTRAEEVGFAGAIAAANTGTIPRKCVVVAMETSSELPHAQMGDGPILRVGDRASVFNPAVTMHCQRVAEDLARTDRTFKYQRRLMDGGMCESSAYCCLGYEATGICLSLGNYHNMDVKRGKIAPEYIDLRDFDNVVKWFVELSRASRRYSGAR